ncbi:MAG: GNAT family N-acetyltransferase [Phycisphaerales bacterium]|nr:GNAT family N-acetyltransferase [Phycisphaerales bacterium]
MTKAGTVPSPSAAAGEYPVERVGPSLQVQAAERLMAGTSHTDRDAGERFLQAARIHGIDIDHLWASVSPDRRTVRQVALVVPGAGRTAMVFTSNPRRPAEEFELGAVIARGCDDVGGARLGQTLLDLTETGARSAFGHAGFRELARLAYMRRERPGPGELDGLASRELPADVEMTPWRTGNDGDLLAALAASYVDTLDCPELCGLREPADVLESHKRTGAFDQHLWWVVRHQGRPEGAVLLSPSPEQGTVELVYLGLGVGLRGKGLGSVLLARAMSRLVARTEQAVTLAVDLRNTPARRLYERLGFAEFAQRLAMVKPLPR